jgi:hypothetical protein
MPIRREARETPARSPSKRLVPEQQQNGKNDFGKNALRGRIISIPTRRATPRSYSFLKRTRETERPEPSGNRSFPSFDRAYRAVCLAVVGSELHNRR